MLEIERFLKVGQDNLYNFEQVAAEFFATDILFSKRVFWLNRCFQLWKTDFKQALLADKLLGKILIHFWTYTVWEVDRFDQILPFLSLIASSHWVFYRVACCCVKKSSVINMFSTLTWSNFLFFSFRKHNLYWKN